MQEVHMSGLKRLVHEIHRRSLWQVLAVYLAASWVALQVVDALTRTAGLPDWVPPGALALLVIGLPIVLGTAIVQEGAPARPGTGREPDTEPGAGAPSSQLSAEEGSGTSRAAAEPGGRAGPTRGFLQQHLTWKRALLGGVAAFALLGFAVTAYFGMRIAGVGPVASLQAQGILDEREPILLADFRNATSDPELGTAVTEALRVDLASSRVVTLVEPARVQEALRRMERDPGSAVTPEIAREIAIRDGIKAVLDGEVVGAGSGYILTATLRATGGGATLATFRRTAAGPDAVIPAIDRLSQDIRERVGESLRSIRSGPPLWQVTTSSLEALRKYSQAEQVLSRGDEMGGLALLREATALDSAFAMAYRKEAVVLRNLGIDRIREIEAVEQAHRHRSRLPEKERYLAEAAYHNSITGDKNAIIRAYEAVLRIDPLDPAALNNLANEYHVMDELVLAEELYRRNIASAWASPVSRQNLIRNQLMQGNLEGARYALAAYEDAHPEDYRVRDMAFWVEAFSGDMAAADRELDALLRAPGVPPSRRAVALRDRGLLLAVQGRMNEAREHFDEAVRTGAQVAPALEHGYRMGAAWIHIWASADTVRAAGALEEIHLTGLMDRIPAEARNHGFMAALHLMVDDPRGALEQLDRWQRELPQEFVTPSVRADRTFYEVWARSWGDDPGAVVAALDALQRDQRCPGCQAWDRPHLLERAGRTREARDAWVRLLARPSGNFAPSLVILPAGLEAMGRLSEELGDRGAAVDAYRRFVELWSNADPELQPRVEAARRRLAALEDR
jgi:eukaryotic-like serine/threonine-protein kinase